MQSLVLANARLQTEKEQLLVENNDLQGWVADERRLRLVAEAERDDAKFRLRGRRHPLA